MADEKIVFKVVVDDEGNIVKLQSTEKGFRDIDLRVKNAENSAKKLNQTIAKTGSGGTLKSLKITKNEYSKLAKTQNQVSDATGSATSATMELSRVISDAPYGIRGMANNITQLVSQLGTASTKAGGLGGALKLMVKQLTGPLGIVFAITAAVSALDYFFGANKKAQKSVSDLTKEVYSSGLVAKQYVKELEDVNLTEERRKVVTQEVLKLIPTLKKEDLEYGKNLDKVRLKIKQYTLAQAGRIEMDKLVEQNSALLSKQMRVDLVNSTEDQEEKVSIIKGLLKDEGIELEKAVNKSYQMGQANLTLRKKTNTELIQDFKDLSKKIEKESKPILEKINNLSQGLALDPDKKGSGKNKKVKQFLLFPPDTIEKQVKFGKKIIKVVADAMGVEIGKNPVELSKLIDTNLSDETKLALKKYNEDLKAEMALSDQLGDAEDFISKSQNVLGSMTDFMNAQFEREITIEANKTNALNTELNNRLNNENLSKDERIKIQKEIAKNDEKLREKQEQISRKQFNMNKASNIANALMDTSAAAIGVMKDAKGGFFSRLAQALPTIAFGLAQVATISRQKFQSSASKTPINTTGGGGGGASSSSERSDPSFNIVGRSNENLLINAIQAQFDKPLKAYVVSRDVTNQQQLDGMIVGQAGT